MTRYVEVQYTHTQEEIYSSRLEFEIIRIYFFSRSSTSPLHVRPSSTSLIKIRAGRNIYHLGTRYYNNYSNNQRKKGAEWSWVKLVLFLALVPIFLALCAEGEPLDPVLVIVSPRGTFEMEQRAVVASECAAHRSPSESTKVTSSAVWSPSANYTIQVCEYCVFASIKK